MKVVKKKGQLIIILMIVCWFFCTDIFNVRAAEKDNKIDLLLDENVNIDEIINAINEISTDIIITEYAEISLLSLEMPEGVTEDDILTNEIVEDKVELAGNMEDIDLGRIDLGATYSGESTIGEYQKNGMLQKTCDEEIFDLLAWHVDEVTAERKSLEISTGEGVRIALIDSGVDYSHPVLAGNIDLENAKSFITNDSDVADTNGHGTMVAGIIKQIAPSTIITPYRVIGDSSGDSSWTISAFIEAVNDGNDIINASLGTYKCKNIKSEQLTIKAFERAVKYAEKNNVIVVAASGNQGLNLDQYYKREHMKHLPGGIKDVNSVSAVLNKNFTSYSNYGSNIQYCAPGGDLIYVDGYLDLNSMIYCLYPTYMDNQLSMLGIPQGYTFSFGTSFSAPMVSAGAADLLSYYWKNCKKVKNKDIEKALSKGAVDLGKKGKDSYYGVGQIDIYNSLMRIFK